MKSSIIRFLLDFFYWILFVAGSVYIIVLSCVNVAIIGQRLDLEPICLDYRLEIKQVNLTIRFTHIPFPVITPTCDKH